MKVFITQGNDSESHFINEKHISELYPQISIERANQLIVETLTVQKDKILKKYINTIHNRKLQESYKDNNVPKPDAGEIAIECDNNINTDPRQYMHGKTVEGVLRSKIQSEIGGNINLCNATPHIADNTLQVFASEIWSDA
ncbi:MULTISPECIES: hypothetical protein [Pseudanabaena]|uniref:Uncharacterized protein n=2 Tax=Pseudanabaena TaxID=1152 RepID=A0A9X4MAL2_9CYAN|nr:MULTISPECIES: hypothetical protein [Pseudanabaena]ELS31649.1 putative ATPase [Pseudanabaena biceps PCC 7429]MDG3496084.1 hypothetical protein [Pseudanabaena catenata USMAC16]